MIEVVSHGSLLPTGSRGAGRFRENEVDRLADRRDPFEVFFGDAGLCGYVFNRLNSRALRDFQVFRRRAMLEEGTDAVTARLLELERRSMLSFLVELGFARAIEVDRTRLADKLALNTLVMRVFPEADVAYRQSLLLALSGEGAQAQVLWDRASRLYPASARAWIDRARAGSQPELDALVQYAESKGEKS